MVSKSSSSQIRGDTLQHCMHFCSGHLTDMDALDCDVLVALCLLFLLDGLTQYVPHSFVVMIPGSKRFF